MYMKMNAKRMMVIGMRIDEEIARHGEDTILKAIDEAEEVVEEYYPEESVESYDDIEDDINYIIDGYLLENYGFQFTYTEWCAYQWYLKH